MNFSAMTKKEEVTIDYQYSLLVTQQILYGGFWLHKVQGFIITIFKINL